jgi:glycosyltransferase involved in cell wall biosynthesis
MAVHDGGPLLARAVESVLAQSLAELELIVVDDGSTDGSDQVLARYAREDPRLVVLTNPRRLGLAASLNRALERARGRYLARMDADDFSLPHRLAEQAAFLDANPRVVIVGSAVLPVDTEGRVLGRARVQPASDAAIRNKMLLHNAFHHPSVMLRRELLVRAGLAFDPGLAYAQDYELWSRLLAHGRGANLPQTLVRMTIHPGQGSQAAWEAQQEAADRVALVNLAARGLGGAFTPEEVRLMRRAGFSAAGLSGRELARAARLLRRLYALVDEGRDDPHWRQVQRETWAALRRAWRRARPPGRAAALAVLARADPAGLVRDGLALLRGRRPLPERLERLTLVIADLGSGGAQRLLSLLAGAWAEQGRQVTVVTLGGRGDDFFTLHPRVRRLALDCLGTSQGLRQALTNNARRLWRLRRAITAGRPQAVISFMDRTNVLTLLATRGLGRPVIATEHSHPQRNETDPVWIALRRLTYPWAEVVQCVSREGADYVSRFVSPARVEVMPAPVLPPPQETPPLELPDCPPLERCVVGLGRLSPEKGFDLLLRAFARLAPEHPEWHLVIVGEGPAREELEELRAELGLEGRAHLPGARRGVYGILSRAGLVVMPSRYEGFPLVLVEAMSCGAPVVVTACTTAVDEVSRGGRDAVVVPPEDPVTLAAAMSVLMASPRARRRLGRRARKVVRRYGLEAVLGRWEETFARLVGEARSG